MLRYPVDVQPDEEFFMVTFPDIPEAITQGTSVEDALRHAVDALTTALDFYVEDSQPIPVPSTPKPGQHIVELPTSYATKLLLLNEMAVQKVRPVELARRLGITRQEVNRLIDWRHTSKIDGIAQALKALGKTLEIRAV
jgi:antitoxin HicB